MAVARLNEVVVKQESKCRKCGSKSDLVGQNRHDAAYRCSECGHLQLEDI